MFRSVIIFVYLVIAFVGSHGTPDAFYNAHRSTGYYVQSANLALEPLEWHYASAYYINNWLPTVCGAVRRCQWQTQQHPVSPHEAVVTHKSKYANFVHNDKEDHSPTSCITTTNKSTGLLLHRPPSYVAFIWCHDWTGQHGVCLLSSLDAIMPKQPVVLPANYSSHDKIIVIM